MMLQQDSAVRIRRAAASDASQIASLLFEAFSEFRSQYTPEAFATTVLYTETIQDRMKEGPFWVAIKNDKIVGTISAVAKKRALYLRSMAVSPEARGYGVGKLLLIEVENFAKNERFRYLTLSTTPFLTTAIRLYESFGFQRTEEGPHVLKGTPLFSMEKKL